MILIAKLTKLNIDIKVKSTYKDRYSDNNKIANSLKVGDVFKYSCYSCAN